VEGNLRKLGVKRWRTKVLDREEWTSIIREAKAKLKGPERYRKKSLENEVLRKVFGPEREDVTGDWRILYNGELRNLCT
jgi:hypothetical protein